MTAINNDMTTGERLIMLEIKLDQVAQKIDELLTRVVTTTVLKSALQEHQINCSATRAATGISSPEIVKLLAAVALALIGGGTGGFMLGQ